MGDCPYFDLYCTCRNLSLYIHDLQGKYSLWSLKQSRQNPGFQWSFDSALLTWSLGGPLVVSLSPSLLFALRASPLVVKWFKLIHGCHISLVNIRTTNEGNYWWLSIEAGSPTGTEEGLHRGRILPFSLHSFLSSYELSTFTSCFHFQIIFQQNPKIALWRNTKPNSTYFLQRSSPRPPQSTGR